MKKNLKIHNSLKIKELQNMYLISNILGSTELKKHKEINLTILKDNLVLESTNKAIFNLYYNLLKHKIKSVSYGCIQKLNLVGIGYSAEVNNNILKLKLGFSHLIFIKIPHNIFLKIIKRRKLIIYGCDLEKITQFSYLIKSYKIPECYKGKGILYNNEKIILKEGKKNN